MPQTSNTPKRPPGGTYGQPDESAAARRSTYRQDANAGPQGAQPADSPLDDPAPQPPVTPPATSR